ncbi:MAG: fumarylacetoacetate hydrolase family protein [Burkholderiales bacterium]|nr:fumarylacetoacetate hydrolase family protein [Burkholderiales bacterium]
MKLCRWGKNGYEKPGMIDSQGMLRDLSTTGLANIDQDTISPRGLARLRKIRPESLPLIKTEPRFGVPYTGISKVVAIGLNYSDHAAEAGMPIPSEPIVFFKATTSITGPNDDVIQPKGSTKLDWEVELAVVIGAKAQYVSEEKALDHVAGYTIVNDVSERNFQLERGTQWDKGKGCDTFCPIGPWLVTTDEITNPQALDMWLDVNGERMQTGSTRTMIFGVAKIVSYCSHFMTLLPGDIIATGTPPGVGMGMKPPSFLKPGDVMQLGIQGLGEQRQKIAAWPGK